MANGDNAMNNALEILRELVATLPKCDECDLPATKAFRRGEGRWCDNHKMRMHWLAGYEEPIEAPDYPRALALRKAMELLNEK